MNGKRMMKPLAFAAVLGFASSASATSFQITLENLSPNVLTPPVFISHSAAADLFDTGAPAIPELEILAEDGVPTGLAGIGFLAMQGGAVADVQVGSGPLLQNQSTTVTLEADPAHPWLSFASMLAVTNDAFIGVTTGDGAINLFPDDNPLAGEVLIPPAEVWDAGTEVNTELAAHVPALGADFGAGPDEGGVITANHPGIQGTGEVPPAADWTDGNVASLRFNPAFLASVDGQGPPPIPEPATLILVGTALTGMGLRKMKK